MATVVVCQEQPVLQFSHHLQSPQHYAIVCKQDVGTHDADLWPSTLRVYVAAVVSLAVAVVVVTVAVATMAVEETMNSGSGRCYRLCEASHAKWGFELYTIWLIGLKLFCASSPAARHCTCKPQHR